MARATSDQIWGKLLDITDAIGDLKVLIATCASNIKAQSEITSILAAHQKEANGNAANILGRLVALELASAVDCGEQRGAHRQWLIIGGALTTGAAIASVVTSIGFVVGWW